MRLRVPLFAVLFAGASLAPGCRCSGDAADAPPPAASKTNLAARVPLGRKMPKVVAIPPRSMPTGHGSASGDPPSTPPPASP